MKETIKKIIVSVMAMASITTFFVGCSGNQESLPPDTSTTISSSVTETPGVPVATGEFTVQFAYWFDSITEPFTNAFEATGKTLLGKIPIYKDTEGNELIVSGHNPIYLDDGKIAPNDLFRNLRTEVTGERVYAYLETPADEIATKFEQLLKDTKTTQLTSLAERQSEDNRLTFLDDVRYDVYVNNMPTDITYSTADKVIPIYSVLNKLNLAWFKGDVTNNTAILKLYTGVGTIEIQIETDENGVYVWSYPDQIDTGVANGSEFRFTTNGFSLSPEKIQTLLGYDVDVYSGGTNYINIVTDNKDLIASSSDLNIENPMDINDVLNPELNTIDTSKPIKTEGSSSNSSSEPTTSSDTSSSEPTSDTHEPTSSSGDNTSKPTSSSSSNSAPNTSKPTSSSSQPTTSKPTSSSSSSGGSTSTGNAPYGGYYDESGALHANNKDVPRDADGYPVVSFWAEDGSYKMTKADKEAWDAETQRIWQGEYRPEINISWDDLP